MGGKAASSAAFMAFVFHHVPGSGSAFSCTGSVVSPTVILTAAHCTVDEATGNVEDPGFFTVSTSSADVGDAGSPVRTSVTRVIPYPSYDRTSDRGDLALLVLSNPVSAPAIRLATPVDRGLEQGGTSGVILGWGLESSSATSTPDSLQYAPTVVQSSGLCDANSASNFPYDASSQLCIANYPKLDTGICSGDSGGPLVVQDANHVLVQIGVADHGHDPCDDTTRPGFFAKVSWYYDWLRATIAGGAPAPPVTPPSSPVTPPSRPIPPSAAPRPSPPQPVLPTLTLSAARGYVRQTLAGAFGQTFTRAYAYAARCSELSPIVVGCKVGYRSGRNDYHGLVTVGYTSRNGKTVWQDSYDISWVNHRCSQSSPRGRCRVSRAKGSW